MKLTKRDLYEYLPSISEQCVRIYPMYCTPKLMNDPYRVENKKTSQ